MIIKYNESGKFVGTFYFSIDPQEIKVIFNEMCKVNKRNYDFLEMTNNQNSPFYKFLEGEVLSAEILRSGIITSQFFKVKYFTLYSPNKPLVGIIKTVGINEDEDIEFNFDIKEIKISKVLLEKRFNEMLLKNEKFNLEEIDVCDEHSVFEYDLRYIKNGKIIEEIKNQEYDCDLDFEIDSSHYLGTKKGDIVILSQKDIIVEALITNVYKKVPFDENRYDSQFLEEFGFNDFNEFKKEYMLLDKEYSKKIKFAEDLVKEFINSYDIKVPSDICDEYEKKYGSSKNSEIAIILDAITRWIYLTDSNYPLFELVAKIDKDMKILNMNSNEFDVQENDINKLFNCSVIYDHYK